jgi:cell division protein ZapA (FtsZ GTPase activity inhibitor)
MNSEVLLKEKEDELKKLAIDLSEAIKELTSKQKLLQETRQTISKTEKKIQKWSEMITQEKQDNQIILSKIHLLEKAHPNN